MFQIRGALEDGDSANATCGARRLSYSCDGERKRKRRAIAKKNLLCSLNKSKEGAR